MEEGPFKSVVEASADKVIKQEFISYYENEDGNLVISKAERRFFNKDFVDSKSTEILVLAQN